MVSPEADAVLGEVRAEMARQRRRQIDIAKATGMSEVKLSRKLNGRSHFTLGELDAVCRTLDVSLADLIRRAENRGTA